MIPKPILRWIGNTSRKLTIRLWSSNTVEDIHSVRIVDINGKNEDFRKTILASLELLRNTDRRRFLRVTGNLDWIVNQSISTPGAEYLHWARACIINFEEAWHGRDLDFSIAFHASLLIHEATHAYLENRGIEYDDSMRSRIEELCVREQNIWASNLDDRELGKKLHQDFNPSDWAVFMGRQLGATFKIDTA